MRLHHFQLGTALGLALLLSPSPAPAQSCNRTCPPARSVFQNPSRSAGRAVIARGTLQETKPSGDVAWNVAGAKPVRYQGLDLKIISGPAQRRLATLNNQTFLAGETLRVIVRGDNLRVRCLEIRDRSVLVEVQGEPAPRELKLAAWQ